MVRVLVVNPGSDFKALVPKLEKLNAQKGPFDVILLLSPPSATCAVPIPTYFAADRFEESEERRSVANNLHYVGSSALKMVNGLAVLLVAAEAESMFSANVDVLVSSAPSGIGRDEKSARLGLRVKPKYHFFAGKSFEKYEPFALKGCSYATRMIQVAEMGSGKWLFAADITPIAEIGEREIASGKVLYEVERARPLKRRRQECWFCLANKVEKHLVTHVGEKVYVALAKGGLNKSHLVIVPVSHMASCVDICDDTLKEMESVMDGIGRYYKEKLGGVGFYFEKVMSVDETKKIMHMCIQAICVKEAKSGALLEEIKRVGEQLGFEGLEMADGGEERDSCMREVRRKGWRDAFWAELRCGTRLAVECNEKRTIPSIFGRVVAARVLDAPQRISWRDCVLPQEQEKAMAEEVAIELGEYMTDGD